MKPTELSEVEEEETVDTTQTKNVVSGKYLKLGATAFHYSKRKNSKYVVTLKDGKKIQFGNPKYADYLIHDDEERQKKYLARATKIKNKQGELTADNPEPANYWSIKLLWN